MEWLDLLEDQGTLKSLLQHHSLKALILWHSTFFMVQLSHLFMTTGKTIALIIEHIIVYKHCIVRDVLDSFIYWLQVCILKQYILNSPWKLELMTFKGRMLDFFLRISMF